MKAKMKNYINHILIKLYSSCVLKVILYFISTLNIYYDAWKDAMNGMHGIGWQFCLRVLRLSSGSPNGLVSISIKIPIAFLFLL